MENEQRSGYCESCGEQSNRIFTPPLITPDDWDNVIFNSDESCMWHCPGQAFPGKEMYVIVTTINGEYLRPYEAPDNDICWECFDGHIFPSLYKYVVNYPPNIKHNGWLMPEWIDHIDLKVLQYELEHDKEALTSITLDLVYGVDCERWAIDCERWAIRNGKTALSRTPDKNGFYTFHLEPIPSSRNKEYYDEFRFDNPESAIAFWNNNRKHIIATNAEMREYYQKNKS